MKHKNPYEIQDPDDLFELVENSSHPELKDSHRLFKFGAYTFKTATELKKFFESEGLDQNRYWFNASMHREAAKNKIVIEIVEKHRARSKKNLKAEMSY